jgi:hypothetical protein
MSRCREAELRAAMDDGEFWAHVFGLDGPDDYDPDLDWNAPVPTALDLAEPCPECGATGACAYDSEGRALIHAIDAEDGAG